MFQGTPGGGIDVLPEMLKAAAIEARVKGESPEESMKALIGLAHMTKEYGPEAIKKLAPAFAFLSTANPSSLASIEKSAGYAVPTLQSSLGIDPVQSLLMGTALTRAGATSTKSGTWLREMAIRAMPGTAIFESEKKAEHHDEMLKRIGLLDKDERPTWFTDGKPDLQSARTGLQEFNVLMQDLGEHMLPAVNGTLHDFRAILEGVRSVLPGGPKGEATIGTRALEGAIAGGVVGAFGGPLGIAGGAVAGGVLGTAAGFMETHGGLGIDRARS
jgi:hypothetical protein